MSKLVFITGINGTGKSTVANEFQDQALVIEVDHIQSSCAKRAFPNSNNSFDWALFTENKKEEWSRFLPPTIIEHSHDIGIHRGHIVAEGAILGLKVFAEAFEEVLASIGHSHDISEVYHFFLNPPADVVFDQIQKRAIEVAHKVCERNEFPDVQSVETKLEIFAQCIQHECWKEFSSTELLRDELCAIL